MALHVMTYHTGFVNSLLITNIEELCVSVIFGLYPQQTGRNQFSKFCATQEEELAAAERAREEAAKAHVQEKPELRDQWKAIAKIIAEN